MQYEIIKHSNEHDLTKEVNRRLAEGWKLQGGVCFASVWFMQAMVKGAAPRRATRGKQKTA